MYIYMVDLVRKNEEDRMISLRCIYSAELEYVSGWMDSVFFLGWGEGEVEDVYIFVSVYTAPEHCLVSIYIYIFD